MDRDNATPGVVSAHGALAEQLAVEIVRLKGGKRKPNIQLLERIRDELGSGQFREASRR